MLKKPKGFKIGDIVRCCVQTYEDVKEHDPYNNEVRVAKRHVLTTYDTLLIIGHDGDKRFIVTPMGNYTHYSNRKYFSHGGFENCYKLLVSYVNENSSIVS